MGRHRKDPISLLMNIFDYKIPAISEDFTSLLEYKNIKIIRIVSSDNIEPKIYIQDEDEWVVILEGKATMMIDSKIQALHRGDTLFIPSGTPHEIINVADGTVWIAVHIR